MTVDKAGNVYRAAAGGYTGSSDKTPDGEVTFNSFDGKTMWATPSTIPAPEGDALWSWAIAGDDDRAAVTWLQNKPGKPTEFYVYVAQTLNAHGSWVTCNGKKTFVKPQWTVANASHKPIHIGYICLNGTDCNADPSFPAGDRRLGDFYTINYDNNGRLFVTGGDTTLNNPVGGPKPVGNPIFIAAKTGAKMIKHPKPTGKTRPSCTVNPAC